jgi:hypothetical protein
MNWVVIFLLVVAAIAAAKFCSDLAKQSPTFATVFGLVASVLGLAALLRFLAYGRS